MVALEDRFSEPIWVKQVIASGINIGFLHQNRFQDQGPQK